MPMLLSSVRWNYSTEDIFGSWPKFAKVPYLEISTSSEGGGGGEEGGGRLGLLLFLLMDTCGRIPAV